MDGGGWAEQSLLSGVPASAARDDGAAKKDETPGAGWDVEEVGFFLCLQMFSVESDALRVCRKSGSRAAALHSFYRAGCGHWQDKSSGIKPLLHEEGTEDQGQTKF